jgi:sterol desaturase/sphingolipid hydroxylase (fatty acid hydroxylase superfamily)
MASDGSRTGFRDRLLLELMLLASVADLASTWLVTPDLRLEGNPLVAIMGGGWLALCLSKLLMTLLAAVTIRHAVCRLSGVLRRPVRDRDELVRTLRHTLRHNRDRSLQVWVVPYSLVAAVIVTGLFAAATNLSGWVRDQSDLPWFYGLCLLGILLVRRALLWWDHRSLAAGVVADG